MGKHEPKEVIFYLDGEEIARAKTIPWVPAGTSSGRLDSTKENKAGKPQSSKSLFEKQEGN